MVILILYITIFCIPACYFSYTFGDSLSVDTFIMACFMIIGFPGSMLGFIARAFHNSNEQVKWEKQCKERQLIAEERARQYEEKLAVQRLERTTYYTRSPLLPEIVKFVTQYGTPYSIHVSNDRINVNRINGCDTYYFSKHGVNNIPGDHVEPYSLAQAINIRLGNQFTLREQRHENNWGPDEFSVIMERPLKNF